MYYFKYNDTNIEKYVVHFNRDELINLRYNVVTNCSELLHQEIDSNEELYPNSKIKNFNKKKNGNIYHYSFDEYVYPRLVSYIDMILRSDDRAIEIIVADRQNDIDLLKDETKKNKLDEYYNRLERLLSFELLITIDMDESKDIKRRTRKILKKRV